MISLSKLTRYLVVSTLMIAGQSSMGNAQTSTLIANPSFETGDFSGWFVQQLGPTPIPLQVSGPGLDPGFGFFLSAPTDGSFAAIMSFQREGAGTNSARLGQNIVVSANEPIIEFDYRAGWIINPGPGANFPRRFLVKVRNPGLNNQGGGQRASFLILSVSGAQTVLDTGNRTDSVNLSSFIGQTVNLSFEWEADETMQGPGFFQLDDIRARSANMPPVADAGPDQSVRVGASVALDGSSSFDDNTSSEALLYAWAVTASPLGSNVVLVGDNTATPSFLTDSLGAYTLALVVTDEGGLASEPDEVVVSTENLSPTANAGEDRLVRVGTIVNLDGSGSVDPEMDALSYEWTVVNAPTGSNANLSGAATATPSLIPDVEGVYEIRLDVSDPIGSGTPDTIVITATTASGFAEFQILLASEIVERLTAEQITNVGNQNAFLNFLSQAIIAIQTDDLSEAIDKLEKSIERTDGCVLRGSVDGNGPGRDWIIDCDAQTQIYSFLTLALSALTP